MYRKIEFNLMDILRELIYGSGYSLVQADDTSYLERINEFLLEIAALQEGCRDLESIDGLRERITKLPESDINNLNIKLSSFPKFSSLLANAFANTIRKLSGDELFLQRRAHVMFNTSDSTHTRAMAHFDGMSGISPFAFTLWVPAHDVQDDSGIWVLDQKTSMRLVKKEGKNQCIMDEEVLGLDNLEPLNIDFSYGLIFNPFVMHGAYPHSSALARIGVSTRFQSRSKPLFIRNSEFFYPFNVRG